MTIWGADADELDSLGAQVLQAEQTLSGIGSNIGAMLHSTTWEGSEADEFRSRWQNVYVESISSAGILLGQAASTLKSKAEQQRSASSADGVQIGNSRKTDSTLREERGTAFVGVHPVVKNPSGTGYTKDFGTNPLFPPGGPNTKDVNQGDWGDCYFAGPIVSLLEHDPGAVARMIHENSNGTYTVTFPGHPPVTVTANLPVLSTGTPVNARPGSDGAIWYPIMEKAFLKEAEAGQIPGAGPAPNSGGNPASVLSMLTGLKYNNVALQWGFGPVGGNDNPFGSNVTSVSDTGAWTAIKTTIDNGNPITASTTSHPPNSGNYDLVGGHDYAIIGYSTKGGSKWIEVQNPFGAGDGIKGPGDAGIGDKGTGHDGDMWIPLDTFRQDFQVITYPS